ncbi:MAG: polyprenyl synthetase family protein [Pseudomonadota bacterium]
MTGSFGKKLSAFGDDVASALDVLLTTQPSAGELERPARLIEAMRHGVLNGGKRLRPFLLVESATLFGVRNAEAMQAACALEMVHCYSLIHDDLPAMDDDDLRRGRPTVHIAFDEATAILAGDALLTYAFDLLASEATHPDPAIQLKLVRGLARAAGHGGMIGGQMLDIAAESTPPDNAGIVTLQAMKTGALIRYACEAGADLGKASAQERDALVQYGKAIGAAFQLADDLLDATSTAAAMGKKTGKDEDRGKATFVSRHGVDASREKLWSLHQNAVEALSGFDSSADTLREIATFIVEREN